MGGRLGQYFGRRIEWGMRRGCQCVCVCCGVQHGRGRYNGEQKQKLVDALTLGPFNMKLEADPIIPACTVETLLGSAIRWPALS